MSFNVNYSKNLNRPGAGAVTSFGELPSGLVGLIQAAADTGYSGIAAQTGGPPDLGGIVKRAQIQQDQQKASNRANLANSYVKEEIRSKALTNELRRKTLGELIKLINAQSAYQQRLAGPPPEIIPAQRAVQSEPYSR